MPKRVYLTLLLLILVSACKRERKIQEITEPLEDFSVEFAEGFSIEQNNGYAVLEVKSPWPNAQKSFRYLVADKDELAKMTFATGTYDAVIARPVSNLVVTSTTHIPALEALNSIDKLVGFPNTKYISSLPARMRIQKGKIQDLGQNETLNTEMTIALKPDVVVGFAITNENSNYDVLKRANIPVAFNGDWVEQTPLGKAEWVKFFGVLLGEEKKADSIFNSVKSSYSEIKKLASKAKTKPKVMSGALYKDVWYAPAGESWAAQFLKDAHTDYRYADSKGTGSLSLSLEKVLEASQEASLWVSPSQFETYEEMTSANSHYSQFKAFGDKNIYTFAATKGPTGGLLYYELAPHRPDLVLKDLVKIAHPELLPDYSPYFFTPLQ